MVMYIKLKDASKYFDLRQTIDPWVWGQKVIFFFSESSRVAYLINGNKAENTMQANFLPFYISTAPGRGHKAKSFFF